MLKKYLIFFGLVIFILSAVSALSQPNPKWNPSQINMTPPSPAEGSMVTFSATFRNAREANTNLRVVAGIDGINIFDQKYPSLSKGQDTVVTFSWTATAGNHKAFFQIDPDGVSPDYIPGDNYIELSFNIEASVPPPNQKPNLVLESVGWNPLEYEFGDTLLFTIKVKNDGNTTSPPSEISYDQLNSPVKELAPGESTPGTNPSFSTKPSSCDEFTVTFVVDKNNTIDELNEGDNAWTRKFKCKSGTGDPNLTITDVTYSPGNFKKGNNVTFNWKLNNIGTATAKSAETCFLVNGKSIHNASIGSLYPDLPWSQSKTWVVECGATISIVADPKNEVAESKEDDNIWQKKIYCRPDYILKKVE